MTDPVPTPRSLGHRYEVHEAIGQGRSTVYRGFDHRLRREVAVKEVRVDRDAPAAGGDPSGEADDVRTRALREARATARLSSPQVVTLYDIAEEDGSLWLVMELVPSPSLDRLVRATGPLGVVAAARIGCDVLAALEAAHSRGIVHRDVKPANVLVTRDGRAKLADFGVASLRDDARVTTPGLVIGSPSYMAPEQALGRPAGPAADLWALGALLYFAVEGRAPFKGNSLLATATAVVHGSPRPLRRAGELAPLITRLLDKAPDRRPDADEVRRTLARVAARPLAATALPVAGVTADGDDPSRAADPSEGTQGIDMTTVLGEGAGANAGGAAGPRHRSRRHRRPARPLAAAVAVVCLLALGSGYAWLGSGQPATSARPAPTTTTTTEPPPVAGDRISAVASPAVTPPSGPVTTVPETSTTTVPETSTTTVPETSTTTVPETSTTTVPETSTTTVPETSTTTVPETPTTTVAPPATRSGPDTGPAADDGVQLVDVVAPG